MPEMENRFDEPCREGEAGIMDGLMGSVNVTDVGRVGDCKAGNEILRERGETDRSSCSGLIVVILRAAGRGSFDVSLRFIAEGRVGRTCGEGGNAFRWLCVRDGAFEGETALESGSDACRGGGTVGSGGLSAVNAVCECDLVGVGLDKIDAVAVCVGVSRDASEDDLKRLRDGGESMGGGEGGGGGGGLSQVRMASCASCGLSSAQSCKGRKASVHT